ncbi:MAG TPA: START domain-containing protein [Mucilaginibacter sp.]|jgi:hypothetical protein|nr:START domain-containing protein [Mucilaginibacter sp.]
MKKIFLSMFILVLGQALVFGQNAWKLNTDKEGIKVYTSEFAGSNVKAIKVECELDASATQLVALLMDVNTSADWVYRTKSCKVIKQVSPSELYYYSEVNMPWPVSNRDFVAHLIVNQNPVTKTIEIDGPAVPGMVPEKKGIVRIDHSIGKWTIVPIDADHIRVQYTLHTEPGGSLPAWMVNMFAAEGPLQVFRGIKAQLQKPVYRDAVLSYIDNGGRVYTKL